MKGRRRAAGVVVVRFGSEGPRYLLLRAFRYWDFPKGEVAEDEDPRAAAEREVREETGLTDLRFRWGERYRETEPYGKGKVARYYVAEGPSGTPELPVSPELGRPEHHEWRFASAEEARRLLGPRVRAVLDWAHALVTREGPA